MPHPRDHAFFLNVVSRNEDPKTPSPITAIITLGSDLVVFKTNSIFHVCTADQIDPGREFAEAKGAYRQVYDIGTSNEFVSRSIIQASEMIGSVFLKPSVSKEGILDIIYSAMREIINCYSIQSALAKEIAAMMPICDQIISESKAKLILPDFPQVKYLGSRFSDVFLSAKRFLQQNMQLLIHCFGKPDNGVKFHRDVKWAKSKLGQDDPLANLLESDNEWMSLIVAVRNFIEHPSKNHSVDVKNFSHTQSNKFVMPSWRYALRAHNQEHYSDLVVDMMGLCINMLEFSEELFCLCLEKIWDPRCPFFIYRMPEDQILPDKPMRYAISVDLDKLRARSTRNVGAGR